MSLIQINNLSFTYEGSFDPVFENVTFQIDTNWKLGFIGRNGKGKSTFLKLLMNAYEYTGSITSSVSFEYFPFTVADPSLMTYEVLENTSSLMEQWELIRELNLLDTDPEILYRPFHTLSFGEQTKALLAALFLKEHAFLLIDEPTNHLDITHQLQLMELVRGLNVTVLSAIHDLNIAAMYCDRLYILKDGEIVGSGTPEELLTPETIRRVYQVESEIVRDRNGKMHILFTEGKKFS